MSEFDAKWRRFSSRKLFSRKILQLTTSLSLFPQHFFTLSNSFLSLFFFFCLLSKTLNFSHFFPSLTTLYSKKKAEGKIPPPPRCNVRKSSTNTDAEKKIFSIVNYIFIPFYSTPFLHSPTHRAHTQRERRCGNLWRWYISPCLGVAMSFPSSSSCRCCRENEEKEKSLKKVPFFCCRA